MTTSLVDLPEMLCHRTPVGPVIEGGAADAAWRQAAATEALHVLRQREDEPLRPAARGTVVRCLWDDARLYLAFHCRCPSVWATKTQRDGELWCEPVAEVFLDVEGAGRSFFEFQINPLGTIYDAFVPDASQSDQWQRWSKWDCAGLQQAVAGSAGGQPGWSAVLSIPLAALAAEAGRVPQAGDVWRANFCRYHYEAPGAEPELSCWAPTVGSFDDLGRFGGLRFVR